MDESLNRFWFIYGVLGGIGACEFRHGEYPQALLFFGVAVCGYAYVFRPWKAS